VCFLAYIVALGQKSASLLASGALSPIGGPRLFPNRTNLLLSYQSLEMGASTLLIDEDTCATNFMIRDSKMQQLVAADKEPITPFVSLVRSIYVERKVSKVLPTRTTGFPRPVYRKIWLGGASPRTTQRAAHSTQAPRDRWGREPVTRKMFRPRSLLHFLLSMGVVLSISKSGYI
jgi:hypothetical protein